MKSVHAKREYTSTGLPTADMTKYRRLYYRRYRKENAERIRAQERERYAQDRDRFEAALAAVRGQ